MHSPRFTAHWLAGACRIHDEWTFHSFVHLIGVTALYVAAAKVGLTYAVVGSTVTLVWAPSGIAMAAVLVCGWRMAFAVALGAFLANVGTGIPLLAVCSIAAGNTVEAVAGAWLLLRFRDFDIGLKTRRDVFAFIVCAAFLGTSLSASVGVATLAGVGTIDADDFATVWVEWWLGDMMGMLVVAPALLLASSAPPRAPSPRRVAEAFCLVAVLVIVSLKIFGATGSEAGRYYDPPLAVFPFVIWGALRFRQLGVSLVTLVFSLIAVWGASQGTGPFSTGNSFSDLVQAFVFSAVVAIIGLLLAASFAEQERAQAEHRSSLEQLEQHVAERTRDLVAANAGLHREMAERRNLEISLIQVSEEQRRAIGAELHDGLGQHLTSLSLLCAGLRQKLISRAPDEAEAVQRIEALIDQAAAMNRSVARGLYPVELEHVGLIAALKRMAEDVSSQQAMKCEVCVDRDVKVDDSLLAINLYRIAQEAVNNAVKHSKAGLMRIDLVRADGQYLLTLRDDGIGFDANLTEAGTGMGMSSMRNRAHLLGGVLQVTDSVPRGTTITVTYPDLENQREQ